MWRLTEPLQRNQHGCASWNVSLLYRRRCKLVICCPRISQKKQFDFMSREVICKVKTTPLALYIYGHVPGRRAPWRQASTPHVAGFLYTLAHTWSHVYLKTYICIRRISWRIPTYLIYLLKVRGSLRTKSLVSRGLRYKFESPVELMLLLARASCSDGRRIPCVCPRTVIPTCYPLSPGNLAVPTSGAWRIPPGAYPPRVGALELRPGHGAIQI